MIVAIAIIITFTFPFFLFIECTVKIHTSQSMEENFVAGSTLLMALENFAMNNYDTDDGVLNDYNNIGKYYDKCINYSSTTNFKL